MQDRGAGPNIGGCGEERSDPTRKSFRFVRARVRAVFMSSESGMTVSVPRFSLFPFGLGRCYLFPLNPTSSTQPPMQLWLALSGRTLLMMQMIKGVVEERGRMGKIMNYRHK